jgi:hypothetical protein
MNTLFPFLKFFRGLKFFRSKQRSKLLSWTFVIALLVVDLGGSFASALAQSQMDIASGDVFQHCLKAIPVTTENVAASAAHSLQANQDWVQFTVKKGQRYRIQANGADSIAADLLRLQLFTGCGADALSLSIQSNSLDFTAQRDATYYVEVTAPALRGRSAAAYAFALVDLPAMPASALGLAAVPAELQRRALDFLEEMRGNPDMPEWQQARLGSEVRLIYRPDLSEPAYYEFLVEKPNATGGYEPAGFIQLSSSQHDYPIPHWNSVGKSPTQEMESLAVAGGDIPSQYYKLDALAYAAEYEEPSPTGVSVPMSDVLQLGTLPPKFSGMEALPLGYESDTTENVWSPASTSDDGQTSAISATLITTGPEIPAALAEEDWGSWGNLKNGYKESYGVLLDGLQQDANEQWSYLAAQQQFGEALLKGDVRTIRALATTPVSSIDVSGAGADVQFLNKEELNEANLAKGLRITVLNEPSELFKELPVDVTIRYTNGMSETKRYSIINAASLTPKRVHLPLIAGAPGQSGMAGAASVATIQEIDAATVVQWGPWSEWWAAGGHGGQPLYNQIPPNTSPNNKSCYSGCVPTAWTMLFGWADRRASIAGSGWAHRWGIYRQNGGYGSDAVAPISEDAGIRNVMMELNGYMGTKCSGDSGGTDIDDEWKAQYYLNGRTGATVRTLVANGWWIFGTSIDDTRDRAIAAIKNGQPVVISTWGHAPMAYGYRQRSRSVKACFLCWWNVTEYERQFYVNQGWGGASNGWIEAKTRFAGEILRN